ncbi:MAG: DUF1431 domain-containing protein [Verrucomicrobia bacterium]|nr:DUF1431 domain-containing protein [Verrucomicrobiota bacterium]
MSILVAKKTSKKPSLSECTNGLYKKLRLLECTCLHMPNGFCSYYGVLCGGLQRGNP